MTLRVCNVPGCPAIAERDGRCRAHARAPWRAGSTTRKTTLPRDWKQRRKAVLRRDGGRCRCEGCPACGPARLTGAVACPWPATDVDHIGDRDDHGLDNLRALCRGCHAYRSSSQGGKAARGR